MIRTCLLAALLALPLTASAAAQSDLGWARYTDPQYGYSVDVPMGVFLPDPEASQATPAFVEIGGAGEIGFYSGAASGLSLDDFARRFTADDPTRTVTYQAEGNSWFVLSGIYEAGDASQPLIFYTKLLLSSDRQTFSGFEISYPAEQKARFDPIVERLEDTFRRPPHS